MKRMSFALLASLLLPALVRAQHDPGLLTVAEKTDFRATARHDDVVKLCKVLADQSPSVRVIEIGKSQEARPIPAMIVAHPPVATPEEAAQSGKLVVLAIGNIHAGEVDGKEALPMLVRELTDGPEPPRPELAGMILIVVPNINPDGNERVSKTNRPGQVGPEEGMGTRENAQGLDLNRDFVKLESPEIRSLVQIMNRWNPHVFIDTHTTNGSYHRFLITHAGPKSVAGSRKINEYVHEQMLSSVDIGMRRSGWNSFAYGNFDRDHARWSTYAPEPRYSTNYAGLRNRIGILSEAYAYAPFRDRVFATRDFVRNILGFLVWNGEAIQKHLAEAAASCKVGEDVGIRSELRPRAHSATVLGYTEERKDGHTVPTSEEKDYSVELWDDFLPKETVKRPASYVVPADSERVIELLRLHGLPMTPVERDMQAEVEVYRVGEVKRAERAFQGHKLVQDMAVEPRTERRTLAAGSMLVPATGQLGSLAVMLLEPRSEDGLATWNFFDDALAPGRDFPVLRLMTEMPKAPLATTRNEAQPQQRRGFGNSPPVRIGTGLRPTIVPGAAGFVRWLDDDHFLQNRDGKPRKVNAVTGNAEPYEEKGAEDRSRLAKALAELPTIDDDQGRGLADRATLDPARKGAFVGYDDDLYYGTLDGDKALRLTSTPGEEELAQFSPDGKFVAFVRDNDLYVVDVATGKERALTTGGTDRVRHGKADWVYFEEIFDRNWRAFWWSPDSKHIAFLDIDDRMIPTHHVLSDTGERRIVEETAYPRAGDPNPQVKLGIVDVAGGTPKYADLSNYSPDAFLISDVGWWPDGSAAYCYGQDRAQTWLDVLKVDPSNGKVNKLFREKTGAWVEALGPIHVLKDGDFLITSERDGSKHLYRYAADGSLKHKVTQGEGEVRGVAKIDEEDGWVYFHGTFNNPIGLDFYRSKLDGSKQERLTQGGGTHAGVLNPKASLLVDIGSSRKDPPTAVLRKADGNEVRKLESDDAAAPPRSSGAPKVEIVQFKTKDGFTLEGEIVFPPDFDDSGKTLYPVWFNTYGGPHAPTIGDIWNGGGVGGNSTLLRDGFILFRLDPRSASGKGPKSAWAAYKHLGVQELEDIKEAIGWLKERPYVDGARIGMSGHSYGGYLTAYCMTHSDLFAAGIAGAPVTDWRDYDSIYTERYMDTPQNNPEGYDASSVVKAAGTLHGKLLILHGGIDDNVSIRNTMRFVHALQQADKDFELMIYPASRHGIFGQHYSRLMHDFIVRTLGGPKPRERAE